MCTDFSGLDAIESDDGLVLEAFASKAEPFDTVVLRHVGRGGIPGSAEERPFAAVTFQLRVSSGAPAVVREFSVND